VADCSDAPPLVCTLFEIDEIVAVKRVRFSQAAHAYNSGEEIGNLRPGR
jgi:hypothetical protein